MMNLISQKMGIHEWSYDNAIANDLRNKVPLKDVSTSEGIVAAQQFHVDSQSGLAARERIQKPRRINHHRRPFPRVHV